MKRRGRPALLLPDLGIGGAERVALQWRRIGCAPTTKSTCSCSKPRGNCCHYRQPEVQVIDLAAPRTRCVLRPLVAYLRRSRPDAIQISVWPLTVFGIIAHRHAGSNARLVVSDHSMLSRQYAGLRWLGGQFLRRSAALFYPLADARVAVSSGVATSG